MTDETWWERNRFWLLLPLFGLRHLLGDSTAAHVVLAITLALITADAAWQIRVGYRRRKPHWTAQSWRRFLAVSAVPAAIFLVFIVLTIWFEVDRTPFGAPGSDTRRAFVGVLIVSMLLGLIGCVLSLMWFRYGRPDKQVEWPQLRVRPTPQP